MEDFHPKSNAACCKWRLKAAGRNGLNAALSPSYSLYWENECGSIGVLETSDEPDGPWEVIRSAGPGYLVDPSKFKQFFPVSIPE